MDDLPHKPPESTPPTDASGGFSKLSRNIARRTTDLIGVAILAVGLLVVGGKLGRWWNTDPQEVIAPRSPLPHLQPWDAKGQGVSLEWGDLNYAIHHQILSGDAAAAGDGLEKIALAKSSQISAPTWAATEAELKLLAELKDVPLARRLESGGHLYRIGRQLPMVILTQPAASSANPTPSKTRRVVCWGRAFPQSEDQWMVFLFYTAGSKTSESTAESTEELTVRLPEGCRKIQRLRDASGQSWTGFRGAGSMEEGQRHFDGWFQDHDWRMLRGWSKTGSAWTVRFQSRETSQRADIWMNATGNGQWEGMVFLSPLDSDQTEK